MTSSGPAPPPRSLDTPLADCDDDDTPFQKSRKTPPVLPRLTSSSGPPPPPRSLGTPLADCDHDDIPFQKSRKTPPVLPQFSSLAAGCEDFDSPLPKFRKPLPKSAPVAAAPQTPSPGPDFKRRDLHNSSPGSALAGDLRSPGKDDSGGPGSAQSGDLKVKTRRDLRLACPLLETEAVEDGISQEGTGPSSDDQEESDDSIVTHGLFMGLG
jgi:hypothetical protein